MVAAQFAQRPSRTLVRMTQHAHPSAREGRAVAIGVAGGLSSGLLGIGGGIVIVPLLVLLLAMPQRRAHAASLAAIAPIALVAAAVYGARGEIWWPATFVIAAGSIVGAPIGVKILRRAPERALKLAFAVLALAAGIRMVLG